MAGDTRDPLRLNSRAIWWVCVALGVIVLTFAAMATLAILAATLKWEGFWTHAGQPFATVIAGMAALGAGGLAFYNGERQRFTESKQWHDEQRRETAKDIYTRFIAAAAQLADGKASTRSFGVYIIGGIADGWYALGNRTEYQVCIDLLTGYLVKPNPDYVHATLTTQASAGEDGTVRATIVRTLATRRLAEDEATRKATRYAVEGADLRAVQLGGVGLNCADLHGVDLGGANLGGAKLERADLHGANLTGADIRGADLRNANLHSATLQNTILYGADLSDADLGGSELPTLARLIGIKIDKDTKLQNAKLCGVDLRGLDLHEAEDIGSNVELTGIRHDDHTIWPPGFRPPERGTSDQ